MRSQLRSKNAMLAAAVGGALLLSAAAWFLVVSPQRSKASRLDGQISAVQAQIVERRAALATPSASLNVRASDLYRLTKAMPDQTDMAGIILALNRLAQRHGLAFNAIEPAPVVAQAGFNVQPITVILQGRFAAVSRFLRDLRQLVGVHRRSLVADGRLFSVEQVGFSQPDNKKAFPDVKATITVDAFMFVASTLATPSTPTTPSASSGTVAAGATH